MFNLREFILKNLITGVQKGIFAKEYASTLAVNYMLKGILTSEDIEKFDEETKIVEQPIEEVVEENNEEFVEEIEEEPSYVE